MINIANAIVSLLTLLALLCFFYGPWQRTAEDLARQVLFERRARLFWLASEGKISFDDQAYKNARLMLNAYIRFAHDLSGPQLFFLSYFYPKASSFEPALRTSIKQVEDLETRQAIWHILNESTFVLIFMMAMKSILFAIPATVLLLTGFCTKFFNEHVSKTIGTDKTIVRKLSENIQARAAEQYQLAKAA